MMSGPALPIAGRAMPGLCAETAALLGIVLLAALLRLYHLGTISLWTDELFTRSYAKLGLGFLWSEGLRLEPTPPLYNSLISFWERVAGDSAFALRLPSFAASVAGIVLTYLIGRELFSRSASALLAAVLLALAPTNISFAQEARAYALQGAALALAMLGFARVLRPPASTGALAAYAVGALLAIYLHLTSVLALAGFNLAALASAIGPRPLLDRGGLRRWLAANALVALACLPIIPILLSPATAGAAGWYPAVDRWMLEREFGITLLGPALIDQALELFEIAVMLLAILVLLPP